MHWRQDVESEKKRKADNHDKVQVEEKEYDKTQKKGNSWGDKTFHWDHLIHHQEAQNEYNRQVPL